MKPDFPEIIRHFEMDGEFISGVPYGYGHINDTYALTFQSGRTIRRYILQRINNKVFKNPEGLMGNIALVTAHLRRKIIQAGGDPLRETLTLIPARGGQNFYRDPSGDYWRVYIFIEQARSYEMVDSLAHVYYAGRAFGNFQQLLYDFPANQLYETIPDFHHTGKRYEAFLRAVDQDLAGRALTSGPEIDFVLARSGDVSLLVNLLEHGALPERVTHNDTKFNNVMIDEITGKGVCVIDLDTVMPGLSLYDFGDSIRSMANPAAEDERDLTKVRFSLPVFDHYARGYLETASAFLTSSEIEHLPLSAILMTLECGMRFLTDHLQGDSYYKIHRESHNLDRCRTQFKLVQDMEGQLDEMARVIGGYSS